MNQKFIAKSNYLLRKVLNSENNLDILQDFVEAILNVNIQKIFLNPYLNIKSKQLPAEENFGIADMRIKTKENQEFNVGIQFIDGIYIQTKLLLYYAQIHSNQIEYKDNRKITKTVTINILNQNYYDSFSYHKIIQMKSTNKGIENNELKDEEILLHVIELPKYQPIFLHNLNKEEQWITYLKGNNAEKNKRCKRINYKINKLDILIDNYWEKEKIE